MTNDSPDAENVKEFKEWVEKTFDSWQKFREWYATTIYSNERKLAEKMWKE